MAKDNNVKERGPMPLLMIVIAFFLGRKTVKSGSVEKFCQFLNMHLLVVFRFVAFALAIFF